jgi:aminoglycoside phosphotransferase (APT) family kinase protein
VLGVFGWCGDHVAVYDIETKSAIAQLQDFIDARTVTLIWEKAMSSKWNQDPVWIHGDFTSGNILIKDEQVAAIIDFGCMGIGDPACDLVIAWTFFKNESRKIFKSNLCFDQDTWTRAQGWALWKALVTITSLKDKTCRKAIEQHEIINEILNEYNMQNNF